MNANPDIDWTAEIVASLRQLWAEGHATAEIGRRLGVTKNAIIGKARRLDLERRPSPIRRDGASAPRTPRLPPAPRLANIMPTTTAVTAPTEPPPASTLSATGPPPAPAPRIFNPAKAATAGTMPCCWPLEEPGQAGFRFCGRPAEAGSPYCTEHCGMAYVRPRCNATDRAERTNKLR